MLDHSADIPNFQKNELSSRERPESEFRNTILPTSKSYDKILIEDDYLGTKIVEDSPDSTQLERMLVRKLYSFNKTMMEYPEFEYQAEGPILSIDSIFEHCHNQLNKYYTYYLTSLQKPFKTRGSDVTNSSSG